MICLEIKKPNAIVTELFIRGRKLNISLVFITQSYFAVPKNIRLYSTHYTKKFQTKFYFLVIDTTLALDNSTRFRINFLEILQKLIMAINDKINDEKLER